MAERQRLNHQPLTEAKSTVEVDCIGSKTLSKQSQTLTSEMEDELMEDTEAYTDDSISG